MEVVWDGDGVPSPYPGREQTENKTSRRTTYAGGNSFIPVCNLSRLTKLSRARVDQAVKVLTLLHVGQ